jgi:hypothetical protein
MHFALIKALIIHPGSLHEACQERRGQFDLVKSSIAFPNQLTDVPGIFSLTFTAKVSSSFNSFILKLNTVQVWSAKFIILHFIFEDIDTVGSPARLVYSYLKGFFKTEESLFYQEVAFNLKDDQAKHFHVDKMK